MDIDILNTSSPVGSNSTEQLHHFSSTFIANEYKGAITSIQTIRKIKHTSQSNYSSCNSTQRMLASRRKLLAVPSVFSEEKKNSYKISVLKVQSHLSYRPMFS
jgi:hypothetical protein